MDTREAGAQDARIHSARLAREKARTAASREQFRETLVQARAAVGAARERIARSHVIIEATHATMAAMSRPRIATAPISTIARWKVHAYYASLHASDWRRRRYR